eukprot:TRINITY_DN5656_c0_g1_i15.p1 TRINITY_DN5656_c0_g1~~TRINITY_DN5656_c0_g1_i15.p1  ORF type:complete len:151 (+),score=28.62 TRINITY_DN5656_c0_g1_i15:289-741(+)
MTEEQQNLLQLINEEEAALLVNGMQEYPEFVDDVISIFLRHEQIFLLSLFVQLLIELFFDFLGIIYHRETIREVFFYSLSIDDNKAKLVFWTVFAGIHHHRPSSSQFHRRHLLLELLLHHRILCSQFLFGWSLWPNASCLYQQVSITSAA